MREPQVQRTPATHSTSLTASGMPSRGGRAVVRRPAPRRQAPVGRSGLRQSQLGGEGEEGVQVGIQALDALQVGLGQLAAGKFAETQAC